MFKCFKDFLVCFALPSVSLYYSHICIHVHVFVECRYMFAFVCAQLCSSCVALCRVGVMYPAVKLVDNWHHGQTLSSLS